MIISSCKYCNKEILKYYKAVFCNNVCKGEWQKENFCDNNNPNFGKKWSEELRKEASDRVKEEMKNPERRKSAGNANRGKKFSLERIKAMHGHRTRESYSRESSPPTEETRRKIGIGSSKKFTLEYREKQRKLMEERGYWIPLKNKTKFEIYFKEADWVERMWDRFKDERIKTIGIFNMRTNTKGLVRDHMFSRKSGFGLGVFPIILRHPENCQILTHAENVSKKKKRYVDDDHIKLEELFLRIENYNLSWKEQKEVVEKIQDYKNGLRYERRDL